MPVGQVRVDYQNNIGEISYSIAPEYRRHGYRMLRLLEKEIKGRVLYLRANVLMGNIASRLIFRKMRFVEEGQNGGYVFIRKIIFKEKYNQRLGINNRYRENYR